MARILQVSVALLGAPFHPFLRGLALRDLWALGQWLWFGGATRDDPFPLFDADFYLEHDPDVGTSGRGPVAHFLHRGATGGRDPHPLFDTEFYLERYPDVRQSKLNPLVHFLRFGAAEGRDPHPLFDTDFYLERCPGTAASGLNPLVHFLRCGAAEGCEPHPLFNPRFYREQAPSEDEAVEANPLLDYLGRGGAGERQPHPLFHPGYYLDRNPDVARTGMDPLAHFAQTGGREGRRPHPLFDSEAYLAQCPEAGADGANPLVHYLERGAAEGLSPHPLFDATRYLAENEDARKSSENPLAHYVRVGAASRGERGSDGRAKRPPEAVEGRTVLAFLTPPRSGGAEDVAADASVVALRVFSALGWNVKAWVPAPPEAEGPLTRLLASSGVEVLGPPSWPSPATVLAGAADVDAIIVDEGAAGPVLLPAMALHPLARLLLLKREPGEGPGADVSTAHFDGVVGDGFRPAARPGLDMKTVLDPAATPLTEAAASSGWPGIGGERRVMGFLHDAGVRPPPTLNRRLTERARGAGRSGLAARDIVVLGLIPWRYRYQRPQHLSVGLGRRGWRVFYVDPDFLAKRDERAFAIEESPADNVFRVKLRMPGPSDIHAAPPQRRQVAALGEALQALADTVGLRAPVLLLQAPFWLPAAETIERSLLAYDCMDLYRAFAHAREPLVALEDELLAHAETVIFSSRPLQEQIEATGRTVVVRNAGEFERFASATPRRLGSRPTVGYVGAVDRWFDVERLQLSVDAHPEWDFVLVGSTVGLGPEAFRPCPNLRLKGEVDYEDVPSLVAGFDACIVPFVDSPLTRCVDPVKIYEYLAAGRPVAATALPELQRLDAGLVHLGATPAEFLRALEGAMAEAGDETACRRRRAWAAGQTWEDRTGELERALG